MNGIRIEKYGSRNWAVYMGDDLVCVTVYKKGAKRVAELLGASVELLPPVQICGMASVLRIGVAA